MQIVVANNATMAVSSYVSYMKQQGFNKNNLIKSKNAMLRFVNGFINRAISGKTDDEPVWRTCYWRDGYTPMTWYFTFYILPQQNLVLIVSFYSQEGSPNVNENRQVIRLNESQLRGMIEKHLKKVLNEICEPVGKIDESNEIKYEIEEGEEYSPYKYYPIGSHKFWSNDGKTERKSIVTLQEPASKQCCHIAEDDHCYVLFNGEGLKDKNCEMITYIFPEAFKALKDLPLL